MTIFLLAFIPALLYGIVVYLNLPYGTVRFNKAVNYLITGVLSCALVAFLGKYFPDYNTMLFTKEKTLEFFGFKQVMTVPTMLSMLFYAFIQVAFIEELSKYLIFKANGYTNKDDSGRKVVSYMFYCMMVAAGFGFFENILYGFVKGGEEIVVLRSFTSIVLHMACGAFMGYYIAKGQTEIKSKYKTFLEKYLVKSKSLQRSYYSILGIVNATILHGLFDFNLFVPHSNQNLFMWIILVGSVWAARSMYKDLVKRID